MFNIIQRYVNYIALIKKCFQQKSDSTILNFGMQNWHYVIYIDFSSFFYAKIPSHDSFL